MMICLNRDRSAHDKIAKPLSLFVLVMLITGSVDSIRNLPVVALFGSQLIFFYIFSAIVFNSGCIGVRGIIIDACGTWWYF